MNISSPRLASPAPSGPTDSMLASPTPTDIQDNNSSHSDTQLTNTTLTSAAKSPIHSSGLSTAGSSIYPQQQQQQFQNNSRNNAHDIQRKNLKTEYKSNFTPFDQYVYNEVTDSFVKHANDNNTLLIESQPGRLSASNSNHDLASVTQSDHLRNSTNAASSATSPALEFSVFEPNNGSDQHFDVTKEPWYKEVVRRNEKAHEYRFKSEVGHNSSLLMNASSNDDIISRKSPLINESAMAEHSTTTTGDDATTSSPAPNDELSSKRSYKFTPQDYKRDHLIATMADNNNFKLPKEDATSRATGASRGRVQLTSGAGKTPSARPATRTPAQVRAKSQSSRFTSTTAASSSSSSRIGDSAASKSNQTTPVKTATPRPMTAARTSTVLTRPARPTTASTTSSRLTTTTTRTATSTNSAMKPASTVTTRRVPMSTTTTSKTSTSTTTSRLASTASSGARTPLVGSTPRPTTARTTTLATSRTTTTTRTPVTSSNTTRAAPSTQATPRSPVKRVTNTTTTSRTTAASSSRPSVSNSSRNSLSTSKTPTGRGSSASTASTNSNAVKSIKTKALADAGEKATIAATTAAAAAAAAATAATVMAVSGSSGNETQNAAGGSDVFASSEVSDPFYAEPINVQEQFPVAAELTTQASQPIVNSYFNQEPNLIFNTSETGNMLADEIAQAEREANETYMKDLHKQSTPQDILNQPDEMVAESEISQRKFSDRGNIFRDNIEKDAVSSHLMKEDSEPSDEREETKFDESHDLVNGLSGRITSAEDRYDSSERETSADYNTQQADQQEQDNDDEPYSIMPTTYDTIEQVAPIGPIETEQHFDESKDELKLAEPKEEIVPVPEAEHIREHAKEQVEVQRNENLDKFEKDHLEEQTNDQLDEHKIDQLVEHKSFEREAAETKVEGPARSDSDVSLEKRSDESLKPEMPSKRVEFSSQPDIIGSNHEHEIEDDHIEEHVKYDADVNEDQSDFIKHDKGGVSQSEPIDLDDADEEFEILDPEKETVDEKAVSSEHSDDVDDSVGEKTKPEQSAQMDNDEHWESKGSNVNLDLQVTERSIEVDQSALEDDEILELQDSTPLEVEDNQHSQIVPPQEQSKHDSEFDKVVGQISSTSDLDSDVISKQDDKQHQQSDQVEPLRSSASAIDEQHAAGEWQTNNKHEDSDDSGEEDEIIDHQDNKQSELLMNVADLVGAESRKKEEMIRKSELARQQSNSRTSLTFSQAGEILLSPDQLHEQLTQSSSNAFDTISQVDNDVVDDDADNNVTRVPDIEAKTQAHELENDDSQFRVHTTTTTNAEESAPGDNDNRGNSTADLVDFGSIDSVERGPNELISEDHHRDRKKPDQESHIDFVNEQTQSDGEQTPTRKVISNIDTPKAHVDEFVNLTNGDHFEITNNQYPTMDMPKEEFPEQAKSKSLHVLDPDDDDDEEQLKLSNHLTNSDDDVILEPRNTKSSLIDDVSPQKIVSGSRYNEGAGLGMMAQDERVEGLERAEIADGLSAEIDNLTVAENRVEIATSKSLMPEISSAPTFVHSVARFAQSGGNFNVVDDDDDDEDLSLNPNADPIDVAATMSPSSSVAEEMLRLSRQAPNASTKTNVTSKLIEELSSSTTKNYADEFARRGSSHESHNDDSKEQVKSSDGETNTTITISPSTKVEEEEEAGEKRITSDGRVELADGTAKMLENVGILSSEAANSVVINNNNDKFNDSISAKKPEQQNPKSGGGGDSDSEISDATSKAMGKHEASN